MATNRMEPENTGELLATDLFLWRVSRLFAERHEEKVDRALLQRQHN